MLLPETRDRPSRVLLVEDDPQVTQTVRAGFDAEQIVLDHAGSVAAGMRALSANQYDAVILDLTLPDGSGLEIADTLRSGGSEVPILMLTAKASLAERLDGFRYGADDYLCKPFAVEELSVRLRALLRRARSQPPHGLKYADVELDLLKRTVRRGDLEGALSGREMDLLAYLMRHPDEVLSRQAIIEDLWGDAGEDHGNTLNVYINYLRNKVEGGRYPRLIHTVRGVGYILSQTPPPDVR